MDVGGGERKDGAGIWAGLYTVVPVQMFWHFIILFSSIQKTGGSMQNFFNIVFLSKHKNKNEFSLIQKSLLA